MLTAEPAAGAPPVVVIAVGNPSRGDDAVGPLVAERIAGLRLPGVEVITDFQLQVEHALDLRGRARVLFVDASASLAEPFSLAPIAPAPPDSPITHALSPQAVLHAYRQLFGAPPECWLLAVRGERFELGEGLTGAAAAALEAALHAAERWLEGPPVAA